MDEKDVFGAPFGDCECNNTGVCTQHHNGSYSSQGSASWTLFHVIPNQNSQHALERIGWQLYFPKSDIRMSRTINQRVQYLERHYRECIRSYSPSEVERCGSFEFKIELARADLFLKNSWPSFENDLKEYPDCTIACIGLAMYRFVTKYRETVHWPPTTDCGLPKLYPRINFFGPEIPNGTIDVRYVGKLITIRGTITRISQQYVNATWRTYKCKNCTDTIVLSQFAKLWICSNCHMGGGIEFISTSVWNRSETQRNITVHRMPPSSGTSKALDVVVPDGIVNNLVPGADVTITGILKMVSATKTAGNIYLQTVCMCINSSNPCDRAVEKTFNANDLQVIREIQSESFPFKLLVQSICPNVKGMETVKAGLLLALFSTSCDTHVLLAGTESNISRQLLERSVSVSPKAVLINDSSQIHDLTLKRTQDGLVYVVAGPLVLTNFGLCGIPRIDKLDNLRALDKMLSDGVNDTTHDTAKNNLEVRFRTTLLATAFPDQGKFEVSKPFMDQFPIPRTFMERFALVFQTEDTLDPEDELVCFNGVRLHPEKPSTAKCSVEIPLVRQLKLKSGDHFDPLPIELMRKYIDYARHHCKPEFTEESTKLLESFFSQMFSMPQWLNISNGMKVAQIQNMVRARARIDLSAVITTKHVMDTIRIVSRSWYDKYDTDDRDPLVNLPSVRKPTKPATIRQFLDVLRSHSAESKTKFFTLKDLRMLFNEVGVPGVADEIVERLNMQGYLLKKSAGRYELLV
ncbi:DNA helicase MCM8-like [Anopheles marshallii]|uniref:DNA helicase MCM8-like n=1 Tax=Anopheles marshallii TaxID=1521116 RepID=UPI00237B0F75|nr:DNA helicase MCM8-like [Anopheles marshallii]